MSMNNQFPYLLYPFYVKLTLSNCATQQRDRSLVPDLERGTYPFLPPGSDGSSAIPDKPELTSES